MAHNLRRPSNTASYSVILLIHLYVSFVNCNSVAYLNLILEGDIKIVATHAVLPQAPSQYTCHDESVIDPSV
jgi:hypothetical protein